MPKRSNPFQRLIHLIALQTAPAGAKVEESDEVVDNATGGTTEVDVTITHMVEGKNRRTVIECRDRGRRDDVQWIRELCGKYATIDCDRKIAVSRSGFTDGARKLARVFGIETLTLEEAERADWSSKITKLTSFEAVEEIFTQEAIELLPVGKPPGDVLAALAIPSTKLQIAIPSANSERREKIVRLDHFIIEVLDQPDQRQFVAEKCAESQDGAVQVQLDLPSGSEAVGKRRRRWPLAGVRVRFRWSEKSTEVTLAQHKFGDLAVAIGASNAATGPIEVAVTQAEGAPPKGSVRMRSGGKDVIIPLELRTD